MYCLFCSVLICTVWTARLDLAGFIPVNMWVLGLRIPILLARTLSLQWNTLWSCPCHKTTQLLEKRGTVFEVVGLVGQCAWRYPSAASWVCVSGQEGKTDPLSSPDLAHSQESVTWVGQPESTGRDCLALYLLPSTAFSSSSCCWWGRAADQMTVSVNTRLCCQVCLTWPPGMSLIQDATLPVWPIRQSLCWAGPRPPAESCQAYLTPAQTNDRLYHDTS